MIPSTMESNSRMALMFNENQSKYKCCCGCMRVRTGATVIAALKMFGVLMAVMDLFTGPYFTKVTEDTNVKKSTSTTGSLQFLEPQGDDSVMATSTENDGNSNLRALRLSSTILYLLLEAVAVSCLIYALRRERPKFVIPEMAFISVCMSLEFIAALLIIVAAVFGSDSLVQIVVDRMHAQGMEVNGGDVDRIRIMLPYILTILAFALLIGAAFELWFLLVLRSFYRYLRDKMAFRTFNNDVVIVQHQCYAHGGYEPMMEETGADDLPQNKDTPPKYQEVVKQQNEAAVPPPTYMEAAEPQPNDARK